MKVLDLFCGAGGAGHGYYLAGYDVVGVDLCKQPSYPHAFIKMDVSEIDLRFLRSFDLIHASPPCQAHTKLRYAPHRKEHLDLIPTTRAMLWAAEKPYVIENVEGAPLHDPVTLCGSMFGLGVTDHGVWHQLQRHRLFETNWGLRPPGACQHTRPVVGIYGGHARKRSAAHGGRNTYETWERTQTETAQLAMGIDWMSLDRMSQAIPPAFTRYIGEQFRRVATRQLLDAEDAA